jgi:GT2 family glycosyltransferase
MIDTPSISVVVCAYSDVRWNDLVEAVASLQRQHRQPAEIIVVVDHNPALLEQARAQFPGVTVIENTGPRGLSGARNSGLAVAGSDVIAFMDEDATADPEWLEELAAAYADPGVLGAGGAILPLWQNGRPDWFPAEFDWVVGCTYRGMPQAGAPVRNLIGCNMSFRRHVFGEAGGFRPGIGRIGTLPVGCEETELCIRVRQTWPEGALVYVPAAIVQHRVPATRATWSYFRSRCYAEGISKALVTQYVGAQDGLSSERAYTLRTLPAGVLRGLGAALRGDGQGLRRSAAIAGGFVLTALGYGRSVLARKALPAQRPAAHTAEAEHIAARSSRPAEEAVP